MRYQVSITTPDTTVTIWLNPTIPLDTLALIDPVLHALTATERTALLTQLIGQVLDAHRECGAA